MSNLALSQAVAYNNEAIELLRSGMFSESVTAFQRALSATNKAANSSISLTLKPPEDETASLSFVCFSESAPTLSQLPMEQGYVFDRPLSFSAMGAIPVDGTTSHSVGENNCDVTVTSTVIMFNFALLCHQLGKTQGSSTLLNKAKLLYTLVLQCMVLQEPTVVLQDDSLSLNEDDTKVVLQCLVLNNLALLQYEGCDYKGSRKSVDQLCKYLTPPCTFSCATVLGEEATREIILNLVYMKSPPSTAHAA
jgi:hypothetical protein